MKTTLRLAILGVASVLALSACSGAQTKAVDTGLTTANMNPSELLLLKTGTWITRSIHDSNGLIYSGKDEFVSRLAGVTRYCQRQFKFDPFGYEFGNLNLTPIS